MSTLSLRKIKHDSSAVDNITLDSNGQVGINATPTAPLTIGRVSSVNEGGQIDLCRSTDNGSAWGIDVYGSTSTPSLRIIDNVAAAVRMQIDSSGRVIMPYQPAFSAGFDNNTGYTTFTGTMLWNNIISNVGSHYNASTGRFTAPVAGNYYFAWNCLSADNNLYAELNLNKNGNVIVRTQQDGGTNQIGGQILIPLSVGDYVTIVATSNGTATVYLGGSGVTYNQFSGFLVG